MDPLLAAVLAVPVAVLVTALPLGLALRRSQRRLTEALARQAAAAGAQRERVVEVAVAAERTRILREMHDVIAHSLAIMIAQADGGSYSRDPQATRRTLLAIADTGRVALADTRRILGILRHDAEAPDLAPVPQAAGVADLVADARTAGVEARFVRLGDPRPLPSAVGLALYRICQESLTNVLKHAPGARVVVTENWLAGEVVLTITDTGDASQDTTGPDGHGMGLIGMVERAEVVGGSCEAGPVEGGGFRVRAVLPSLHEDRLRETIDA